MKKDRKIPLLNEFYCRGRIVGKGGFKERNPYLTIFINGKREPNYMKVYFESVDIHDFKMNQTVYITGFVKSPVIPYLYEGRKEQYFLGEKIVLENTLLSEAFEIENIGFSFKNPFSRVFLSGSILSIKEFNNWITIQVRDYREQVITLQYSKNMRVNDVSLEINDFVFISAIVVSSRKNYDGIIFDYEDIIVDDLAVN